ncbi:Cobalamin biosynthesis protein CobD [Burkholderiales bacterium]|nr:Cobalamin biosynthesis protein CobD [Burkholderiales bacterium]
MSWLALILTLLLEQVRAMPSSNPVYAGATAWADKVSHNLNAGKPRHGAYGWLLVVGAGVAVTVLVFELARSWNWFAALAIDVLVLFFALGFRQFSHPITVIQTALERGDADEARRVFAQWRRRTDPEFDPTELNEGEIARQSIEFGLLAAHRHVFGVLFWFLVLPGPSGAVLYRLSEYLSRHWNRPASAGEAAMVPDQFGQFAQKAYALIDWLPARLTALGFAIVGDFEGAAYCWRHMTVDSKPSTVSARGLILAAAGGAMGVRVLSTVDSAKYLDASAQEGAGLAEPGPDALRSAVGLAWRAMVLWLVLLLLLTLAAALA